jgi:hypothetical protein
VEASVWGFGGATCPPRLVGFESGLENYVAAQDPKQDKKNYLESIAWDPSSKMYFG